MAIVSSVFKTSTTVVSSTFKVGSAVVSSTFRTGGVKSTVFKTQSQVVSSIFKVSSTILSVGVTYTVAADCGSIIVSIDRGDFTAADIKRIDVNKVGDSTEISSSYEQLEGIIEVTIPITSDGVYEMVIEDNGGAMVARVPMLVICRLAKCFTKYNSQEVLKAKTSACDPNGWILLFVLYRGIISNFKTTNYDKASSMVDYVSGMCKDMFGDCNSCSTC